MIEKAKGYYLYLQRTGKLETAVANTAKFMFITAPLELNSFVEKEARIFINKRNEK